MNWLHSARKHRGEVVLGRASRNTRERASVLKLTSPSLQASRMLDVSAWQLAFTVYYQINFKS